MEQRFLSHSEIQCLTPRYFMAHPLLQQGLAHHRVYALNSVSNCGVTRLVLCIFTFKTFCLFSVQLKHKITSATYARNALSSASMITSFVGIWSLVWNMLDCVLSVGFTWWTGRHGARGFRMVRKEESRGITISYEPHIKPWI